MLVGAVIETIVDWVIVSPIDDTLSEIAGDYRHHSHHHQRNDADTHVNRARVIRRDTVSALLRRRGPPR